MMEIKIANFSSFYNFYLTQHSNSVCKLLHFVGILSFITSFVSLILIDRWALIPFSIFWVYLFSWVGHFFFEKNMHATFKYPLWSIFADVCMFRDILIGKISLKD
jgi:hypothetical protein